MWLKRAFNYGTNNTKIIVGLTVGLILVVVLVGFSIYSNSMLVSANERVLHTQDVILRLETLIGDIQEIESSNRGYVITGIQSFENVLDETKPKIQDQLDELKKLISDNAAQTSELLRVEKIINQKIQFSDSVLTASQEFGNERAAELIRTERGSLLMNQIKNGIAFLQNNERELLKTRFDLASENAKKVYIYQFLSIGLIFFFVIASAVWLFKEIKEKSNIILRVEASEKYLNNILDNVTSAILVFNHQEKLAFINAEAQKLFKRSFNFGTPADDVFALLNLDLSSSHRKVKNPVSVCINEKEQFSDHYIIKTDSKELHINIKSTPIFDVESEQLDIVLVSINDVSTLIEANIELKSAMNVKDEGIKAKESFMANMSHEIRTPLNAIIGFSDLLENTQLNEEQRDFIRAIHTSGENLLHIINDILDLSKMDAGMMKLESTMFSPEQLLRSLIVMFKPKANQKGIVLDVDFEDDLPEYLLGDPNRLTQILINLINNAIKFTDAGKVTLIIKLLSETQVETTLEIMVRDTGIGIPAHKLNAIFNRFEQVDDSHSREYGGTGLGLSIVKNLVELQSGSISVDSKEYMGTTFTISLPYKMPNEKQINDYKSLTAISVSDNDLSGISVLLVEDNPMNSKLAVKLLEKLNVKILVAETGKKALEFLKFNDSFDIILMDIQLPELDGYQTTHIIRNNLNNSVPIIAMTAHTISGEREKCIQAGMNDYLSKPFKPVELIQKIKFYTDKANHVVSNSLDENLIDFNYLQEISDGDKDFSSELINTFINQIDTNIESLISYTNEGNWSEVIELSHRLKSSAGVVGFSKLRNEFEQIELDAKGNKVESVTKHVKSLKTLSEIGIKQLKNSPFYL
ncbi:response regulator [bacterium]|nr:MAG: response regulator [bacterium]